jgi:hypothetical protein
MGVTNDDEIPVKELESSIPPTLKDKFEPSYDHIIPDMTVPDKDHSIPEHISDPSEIEYVYHNTKYSCISTNRNPNNSYPISMIRNDTRTVSFRFTAPSRRGQSRNL